MSIFDALPEESTTPAERRIWDSCFSVWCAWRPAATAPRDGSHILVCRGPFSPSWTFLQEPPAVVHYWGEAGAEGFYLSHGLTPETDKPFEFAFWRPLPGEPRADRPKTITSSTSLFDAVTSRER